MTQPIFAVPTANPEKCSATFKKWQEMGYLTAALVDGNTPFPRHMTFGLRAQIYKGWPTAVNALLKDLMLNTGAEWFIAAGDDMAPDPNLRGEVIAAQCTEHFKGTLGVMQPTGDPWMVDASGRCAAERICGSPWLGREFIRRWNNGKGPFSEEYFHCYADEQLHDETLPNGFLWQRKDLSHWHHHPNRTGEKPPGYMQVANNHFRSDQAAFRRWQAAGSKMPPLLPPYPKGGLFQIPPQPVGA
jgi:hypothetical protein